MFNVLRPGSRLLDRLHLRRKFGLISLFIFIPALLTNYLRINLAAELTTQGASRAEHASRELGHLVSRLNGLIGTFRV